MNEKSAVSATVCFQRLASLMIAATAHLGACLTQPRPHSKMSTGWIGVVLAVLPGPAWCRQACGPARGAPFQRGADAVNGRSSWTRRTNIPGEGTPQKFSRSSDACWSQSLGGGSVKFAGGFPSRRWPVRVAECLCRRPPAPPVRCPRRLPAGSDVPNHPRGKVSKSPLVSSFLTYSIYQTKRPTQVRPIGCGEEILKRSRA